jgi:anti-sigma factor RsiW
MSALDRYTCEETFRRLDDYLDRELSPDEQRLVEEHLRVCGICASEFRFEQSVLDGVRDKLSRLAVPADLMARIQELLTTESSPRGNPSGENRPE